MVVRAPRDTWDINVGDFLLPSDDCEEAQLDLCDGLDCVTLVMKTTNFQKIWSGKMDVQCRTNLASAARPTKSPPASQLQASLTPRLRAELLATPDARVLPSRFRTCSRH